MYYRSEGVGGLLIDFSTVRGEMSENQGPAIKGALLEDASQTHLQTAPMLSSTGDKLYENVNYHSDVQRNR